MRSEFSNFGAQLAAGGRRRRMVCPGLATRSSPDAIIGGDDSVQTIPAATCRELAPSTSEARSQKPEAGIFTFRRNRQSAIGNRQSSAFTLTEILIVIGLIVLLIAIAVPAFNLISGGRSIEGATNQLSAALGRARAQAIGLQKKTGVLFIVEPKSQRKVMAIVTESDGVTGGGVDVWLDLDTTADFIPLPPGVSVQTMCDTTQITNAPYSSYHDRYFGFNLQGIDATAAGAPHSGTSAYGGVILFDANGRLASARYGLRCIDSNGVLTSLGTILNVSGLTAAGIGLIPAPQATPAVQFPRSQFGIVMFEIDPYTSAAGTEKDFVCDSAASSAGVESTKEAWLDQNATPILINRYTGTLVKGE